MFNEPMCLPDQAALVLSALAHASGPRRRGGPLWIPLLFSCRRLAALQPTAARSPFLPPSLLWPFFFFLTPLHWSRLLLLIFTLEDPKCISFLKDKAARVLCPMHSWKGLDRVRAAMLIRCVSESVLICISWFKCR